MRIILFYFFIFFCIGPSFVSAHGADEKIGIIDIEYIIDNSKMGRSGRAEIEKRFKKQGKNLRKKKEAIEALKYEIESNAMIMRPEDLSKKEDTYREIFSDYENEVRAVTEEFSRNDRELREKILMRVREVAADLAAREGYTIILEKSGSEVIFFKNNIDLTSKILKHLD